MQKPSRKELSAVNHSRINSLNFTYDFLSENNVKGKIVIDISAGSGYVANLWYEAGAVVTAYDKYPENNTFENVKSQKIDLDLFLPIGDNTADYVLLMETIDHIPNQFQLLAELSRILKPGGILIITKPNNSNFTGKMANVWLESERGDMFLPNEASIIAFDNGQRYNPRIFLCGIQKLRTMAGFANLKVDKIYSNQLSYSSLAWYIILGIFFYIRTFFTFRKIYNRASDITEKEILKEQYKVNNNMTVLLHKHLCVSFRKMVG